MVRATVEAVDDGVGRALQFIVDATLHQPAQDRLGCLVAVEREAAEVGLPLGCAHRPVHGLDDVAADAEIAQGWLEAGFQSPLRRADLLGRAEAFELGGPTNHQTAKLGIFAGAAGAEIGDPALFVGDGAERSVEAGPTLGIDLFLKGVADLALAARPQFQRDPLRCAAAKAVADLIAADEQVLPLVSASADEHMDVRIVGVPVIDRHPIKLGVEVALRVGHQFPSEGAKIGHLARIL